MTDHLPATGVAIFEDDDDEDLFGSAIFYARRHVEILRRDRPEYYRQLQREWEERL